MDGIKLNNLYFLGDRNYVQGGTIYEAIIPILSERYGEVLEIDFMFYRVVKSMLVFSLNKDLTSNDINVVLRFSNKGNIYKMFGYKSDNLVVKREQYNEDILIKDAVASNSKITFFLDKQKTMNDNVSVVRYVIALNKKLLTTIFPDETRGHKWFLSRIFLNKVYNLREINKVEVKYISRFDFRLVKSIINIDGFDIGEIYFTLMDKSYTFNMR